MEGVHVSLRVSPMNGFMRFKKKGKLIPRFIGPFEILILLVEVQKLRTKEIVLVRV